VVRRPLVSVVMAVRNGERHLREAIDSVLAQSFNDFELIITDDGSTDGTSGILASIDDSRLQILTNPENLGIPKSVNRGLDIARGRYVARFDADDVCLPTRFDRQVRLLESTDVSLTCSNVLTMDLGGEVFGATDRIIDRHSARWHMMFDCYLIQPTVMWNREEVRDRVGNYNERFLTAQDFELIGRIVEEMPAEGIQEPLVRYRVHDSSVTATRRVSQKQLAAEVSHKRIRKALPRCQLTDFELDLLRQIWSWEDSDSFESHRLTELVGEYLRLWQTFLQTHDQWDWDRRSPGLRWSSADDAAKIAASYLKRKEAGALVHFLRQASHSLNIPSKEIYQAAMRRRSAQRARTS